MVKIVPATSNNSKPDLPKYSSINVQALLKISTEAKSKSTSPIIMTTSRIVYDTSFQLKIIFSCNQSRFLLSK